jgi:molecular chaperone DnaK
VFEVKSTNGDTFLGGEDFRLSAMSSTWPTSSRRRRHRPAKDKLALQRLKEAAEKAKIELSSARRPRSTCPSSPPTRLRPEASGQADQPRRSSSVWSIRPDPAHDRAAARRRWDAGLKPGEIDEVVMVGGMTRMPKVRDVVKQFFGKEPTPASTPMRSWRSAPRSRPACCRATSRTCCCST